MYDAQTSYVSDTCSCGGKQTYSRELIISFTHVIQITLPLSGILWVSVQVGTVGMSPLLLLVETSDWKTGQQRMSTSDGEAHCVTRFQVVSAVC